MSKIPNGPAKIEVLSRKGGLIEFRFVSFPELLRRRMDEPFLHGPMDDNNFLVVGKWEVYSRGSPEYCGEHTLFCPGSVRELDNRSVTCKITDRTLKAIVRAINARAKKRDWHMLKARIAAYREHA